MPQHFYLKQFYWLVIGAALLGLLFPIAGQVDIKLIRPYIDPAQGFIYKNYWWYDQFAHAILKLWQELIFIVLVIWLIANKYLPSKLKIRYSRRYWTIILASILSTVTVGLFKHYSSHSCPWSILNLSPQIQFLTSIGQGRCFPGGHASLGYAWCAGFFAFYAQDKRRAYFYLIAGMCLGTLMGWTQMMRGAHFFSHNLWTFWLTWAVLLIMSLSQTFYWWLKRTDTASPPSV